MLERSTESPRNIIRATVLVRISQGRRHNGSRENDLPLKRAPPLKLLSCETEQKPDAAKLEKSLAVLANLKELEFHSRANIEKLAELSLTIEDELKQKAFVEPSETFTPRRKLSIPRSRRSSKLTKKNVTV